MTQRDRSYIIVTDRGYLTVTILKDANMDDLSTVAYIMNRMDGHFPNQALGRPKMMVMSPDSLNRSKKGRSNV